MKIGFPSDIAALCHKVSYDIIMALPDEQFMEVYRALPTAPIRMFPQ